MQSYLKFFIIFLSVSKILVASYNFKANQGLVDEAALGNMRFIKSYVKKHRSINVVGVLRLKGPEETKTILDVTPFMSACAYGHLDLAKYLAEKGHAIVNYTSKDGGYQATHIAAFNGYPEPVKYCILKHGLKMDTNDQKGFNVIRQAALGGHHQRSDNCQLTLRAFDQVSDYIINDCGLLDAIKADDLIAVKACIEHGHKIDAFVSNGAYNIYTGHTALTYAHLLDRKEIIQHFKSLK